MATGTVTAKRGLVARFGNRGGLAGYFFVLPSIIFLMVFVVLPIIAALYYSLTDYDLMSAPKYAGLMNYRALDNDPRFSAAVKNTLYFAGGTVPAGVVTSLLLAALINRSIRGIYTFRALFYMPVVSSFVSVGRHRHGLHHHDERLEKHGPQHGHLSRRPAGHPAASLRSLGD